MRKEDAVPDLPDKSASVRAMEFSQEPTQDEKNSYQCSRCDNLDDTSYYCEQLEKIVTFRRRTHWMTVKLYENRNRLFVIPILMLTTISGIASFFAASGVFDRIATQWLTM